MLTMVHARTGIYNCWVVLFASPVYRSTDGAGTTFQSLIGPMKKVVLRPVSMKLTDILGQSPLRLLQAHRSCLSVSSWDLSSIFDSRRDCDDGERLSDLYLQSEMDLSVSRMLAWRSVALVISSTSYRKESQDFLCPPVKSVETFPIWNSVSCNRVHKPNCLVLHFSSNSPGRGWPYSMSLKRTTGSSMLDQRFGRFVLFLRPIQISGNSSTRRRIYISDSVSCKKMTIGVGCQ